MYTEGQTLKLTTTSTNPLSKIFAAPITVTVVEVEDNLLYVQLSAEDAARHPLKRNMISFVFENNGLPTFYPDWTIEVVGDEPEAIDAETVGREWAAKMIESNIDPMHLAFDVSVAWAEQNASNNPEAADQFERAAYAEAKRILREKKAFGVHGALFHKDMEAEADAETAAGYWPGVDARPNMQSAGYNWLLRPYIEPDFPTYDGSAETIEKAFGMALKEVSQGVVWYKQSEDGLKAAFEAGIALANKVLEMAALNQIMTAGQVAEDFNQKPITVRKACERAAERGETWCRLSKGTWIMSRKEAEARWGKK